MCVLSRPFQIQMTAKMGVKEWSGTTSSIVAPISSVFLLIQGFASDSLHMSVEMLNQKKMFEKKSTGFRKKRDVSFRRKGT